MKNLNEISKNMFLYKYYKTNNLYSPLLQAFKATNIRAIHLIIFSKIKKRHP